VQRFSRWLFTAPAIVMLLLLMATAVLWIRNIRRPEAWKASANVTIYSNRVGSGQLEVQWLRDGAAGWYVVTNPYSSHFPSEFEHQFLVGELDVARLTTSLGGYPAGTIVLWSLTLQYWFLCLLFASALAWAIARIVRKCRTKSVGVCAVCGYDLRATPERCPECGTVPATIKLR
jgi:hypothetical protein